MSYYEKSISLEKARKIAELNALKELGGGGCEDVNILKDEYSEGECCWMFFKSDDISVSPEMTLGIKWAYVVSKKGTYSMVQDFSDDPELLSDYLKKMSEYFRRKNE